MLRFGTPEYFSWRLENVRAQSRSLRQLPEEPILRNVNAPKISANWQGFALGLLTSDQIDGLIERSLAPAFSKALHFCVGLRTSPPEGGSTEWKPTSCVRALRSAEAWIEPEGEGADCGSSGHRTIVRPTWRLRRTPARSSTGAGRAKRPGAWKNRPIIRSGAARNSGRVLGQIGVKKHSLGGARAHGKGQIRAEGYGISG